MPESVWYGFLLVTLLTVSQSACSDTRTSEQAFPSAEWLAGEGDSPPLSSRSIVYGEPEPVSVAFVEREGESVALHEVAGIVVLPERGVTVVADHGSRSLRYFSPEGQLKFSVGGEGGGPGEFMGIGGLWRYGADSLLVFDPAQQRGTVWDVEGKIARTITVNDPLGVLRYVTLRGALSDGRLIWTAPGEFGSETGARSVAETIVVTSPEGEIHQKFGPFPGEERTVRRGAFDLGEVPFGGELLVGVRGDQILLTNTRRLLILTYLSSGRQASSFGAQVPAEQVTEEFIRQDRARRVAWYEERPLSPLRQSRLTAVASLAYPDSFPVVGDLRVAEEGEVWVAEYAPPDRSTPSPMHTRPATISNVWHVFDDSGSYAGTVSFPKRFVALYVSRDLVVGVERDDLDVERISAFRVRSSQH